VRLLLVAIACCLGAASNASAADIKSISRLAAGPENVLFVADKLCCIDTGAGMTGPEMVEYINALSSSIHQQSATGNFGVGAKIAAAPRNPHGMLYMSWKNGVGHMIHLWFDPEEHVYGVKRWPKNNGEFWTQVSNDLRPPEIKENGTVVVLLGSSDEHDTMQPPPDTPMRSRWILRYLNTRYFRFPEGITVKAREGWELPRSESRHNLTGAFPVHQLNLGILGGPDQNRFAFHVPPAPRLSGRAVTAFAGAVRTARPRNLE
jgi:hypothetical protein